MKFSSVRRGVLLLII